MEAGRFHSTSGLFEVNMRILWVSNTPWSPTGYGNQTWLVCRMLPKLGHELAVASNYGLQGSRLDIGGVKIYPVGRDKFSNDVISAYADDWQADVVISLYDAWTLNFAKRESWHNRWIAWAPVDTEKASQPIIDSLHAATRVVAYSKHGLRVLQEAGIDAAYIPHGINTSSFMPGDKLEARKLLNLPADCFLVGMIAANIGYPSRKSIPEVIMAFSSVYQQNDKALLYLHMIPDETHGGVNVNTIAKSVGLEVGKQIIVANAFDYLLGYPEPAMVQLYRAMDVLANPSTGEGFGIPIMEAMACGTPVIGTNCTSMPELIGSSGWLVEGEPFWEAQGGWRVTPHVYEIADAMLNAMIEPRPEKERRSQLCRVRALEYDAETIMIPAWNDFLQRFAAEAK